MKWNINEVRKIAGLPLNEGWGDDDDADDYEDPDAKIAASDKGQRAFEKKNSGELKAAKAAMDKRTADQKAAAAEKKAAAKKEEPKAEEKKPEPAKAESKAEEKKAEPAAKSDEAKKRGRAENPDGKQGKARAWLESNPSASRKEFMSAHEHHGMTAHHANTFYYAHKKKKSSAVSEMFYISHPSIASFVLAENREMNEMVWVDADNKLEPMVFETMEAAEKVAKYMKEWRGMGSVINTIDLNA